MSEPIRAHGDWTDVIARSSITLNRAIAVYLEAWTASTNAQTERLVASARGLKLAADDLNLLLDDVGVERL